MNLLTTFNQLGLREDHLKIYLANLEWGETIITNIARKAKLPRTSVYILIKDLLNLGLVTQSMRQGKTVYIPADPELLTVLLKRRQLELQHSISEVNSHMSQLKAIQNSNVHKPKVEYLEGSEGIQQAYERTFNAKETVLIQCLTEDYKNIISEEFMDDYFNRFFGSEIKSKEILKFEDEEYVSQYRSDKNLQLRVPIEGKIETDLMVFDNTVIFVSFNKENPYALIIEDQHVANCMKSMYGLAWKQAAVVDPQVQKGEKVKTEF